MKKFKTRYDWKKVSISFDENSSLTIGSEKDSTDINLIIKQYISTGTLPNSRPLAFKVRYPMFGDFSSVTDYQTAIMALDDAKKAFMDLPSKVREKFGNNPSELISFLSDSSNYDEAVRLGLIEKKLTSIVPDEKPHNGASSDKNADLLGGNAESVTVGTI